MYRRKNTIRQAQTEYNMKKKTMTEDQKEWKTKKKPEDKTNGVATTKRTWTIDILHQIQTPTPTPELEGAANYSPFIFLSLFSKVREREGTNKSLYTNNK